MIREVREWAGIVSSIRNYHGFNSKSPKTKAAEQLTYVDAILI